MSFSLLPAAMAASTTGSQQHSQQGGMGLILWFVLLLLLFYFLMWRPQSKRIKEQRKMMDALEKGDEVVTNGGLLGKIAKISDDFLTLNIAEGVDIKVQKQAISQVLPKGTMKAV